MRKEKFERWMKDVARKPNGEKYKVNTTVPSYVRAISKISEHYLKETGEDPNIYEINDLEKLKKIKDDCDSGGKFEALGKKGRRTNINAIKRYLEFFEAEELQNKNKKYN